VPNHQSAVSSPEPFRYEGPRTRAISFPLGGIGTGSIGLSGTGRLVDWEIFNRPNKNGYNGFSFFALRAEYRGKVEFAKVLHGDLSGPYSGEGEALYRGFGFGVGRETMAGFPHFKRASFLGRFPIAEISFSDDSAPCDVTLTAFNPFIPLNDSDSSIPAAILVYRVINRSDLPLNFTLAGALANPFLREPVNSFLDREGMRAIRLNSRGYDEEAPEYGDICISTDGTDVTYQEYWYRGEWFDNITVFWRDFCTPGPLNNRTFPDKRVDGAVSTYNFQDECVLGIMRAVKPGQSVDFRFAVTWSFPNFVNYWNPGLIPPGGKSPQWKNHYATRFRDSMESAHYVWANYDRLFGHTRMFQESLFATTLPSSVIDAVSANLSIMKSPTCVRLTDGTLYGFEGCHAKEGCCEGSCAHVWNYEQAFPFLFPALSRSMREMEYQHCQFPNGKMAFRLLLPPERTLTEKTRLAGPGRAAADGQMGGIIKVYREWRVSGDTEWLRRLWPGVKRALEYAWEPTNEDWWDKDRDGVMEGVQHHTLDVEIYGPNTYITSQYHAALVAAAEMAEALDDPAAADYRTLYKKGRAWVESNLFNGEYFHQKIDLQDSRFPVDPELGEIKYQIGEGCHVDQVLGQWYGHLVGLGYLLDPGKVHSAVRAIYRHNFLSMRNHVNANRIYALNDEEGLVICTWPRGGAPRVPVPYASECMNGFEYQAASHLIIEGFVEEGLRVVEALRARYDGNRRNPWNEFECGSNYARSMASYALLISLSGFEYDVRRGHIGFSPRWQDNDFRCFWALNRSWGDFIHDPAGNISLVVRWGELKVLTFCSHILENRRIDKISVDGTPVAFHQEQSLVEFAKEVTLNQKQTLIIKYA
jgi:uncharacterized protein (DUF608 family)